MECHIRQLVAPVSAVTPPSRSETAIAARTVYAIRYYKHNSPSPGLPEGLRAPAERIDEVMENREPSTSASSAGKEGLRDVQNIQNSTQAITSHALRHVVFNLFKRKRADPPAEGAGAQITSGLRRSHSDCKLTPVC
jgi:hypothetical protein